MLQFSGFLEIATANALDNATFEELYDGNGALLEQRQSASNAAEIEATGIAPTDNRESAIRIMLTPENYAGVFCVADGRTAIAIAGACKVD